MNASLCRTTVLASSLLVACFMITVAHASVKIVKARAIMTGNTTVTGDLRLTEFIDGTVHITGQISGLSPGKHGFHVHKYGDIFSRGCYSSGPHYNPFNVLHGGRQDSIMNRHLGDLGNVEADENGVAHVDIKDKILSLSGPFGVVGRAMVVHSNEDDLGVFEDDPGSIMHGNSGDRLACGIIFIVP